MDVLLIAPLYQFGRPIIDLGIALLTSCRILMFIYWSVQSQNPKVAPSMKSLDWSRAYEEVEKKFSVGNHGRIRLGNRETNYYVI